MLVHVSLMMAPILTQFPPCPSLLGDGCQEDGLPGDLPSTPHALPSLRVGATAALPQMSGTSPDHQFFTDEIFQFSVLQVWI